MKDLIEGPFRRPRPLKKYIYLNLGVLLAAIIFWTILFTYLLTINNGQ